jgi:hypothetical protein
VALHSGSGVAGDSAVGAEVAVQAAGMLQVGIEVTPRRPRTRAMARAPLKGDGVEGQRLAEKEEAAAGTVEALNCLGIRAADL